MTNQQRYTIRNLLSIKYDTHKLLTTFNVLPHLISLVLAICEGTTVRYTTLKHKKRWCYIKISFLLVLDRCWFWVSHFCRFISGTHWIVGLGKRSWYSDLLQAGRSGNRIPVCMNFSAPVQTGSDAHPASYTMSTASFRWWTPVGVALTTQPHLPPRLKKE